MRGPRTLPATLALAILPFLPIPGLSADWPTWRADGQRSAVTSGELPDKLHVQWVRAFHPLEPAWEEDPRLYFDAVYEPVVLGKQLFLASSRRNSVAAFSTQTGEEQWRFFTNGPVRFAPLANDGKVYLGSDDGHVYCLKANDGSLLWKFNAAPSRRKVIGNERLIPVWPVRGSPVLDDGKLYFTAGVWPFEGAFLYTLDAATGKPLGKEQALPAVQAIKDQSPQGYLAVSGRRLFIPCGRAQVFCVDRATGKPVRHKCDSRGLTDYHAVARGPWLFHGHRAYHMDKLTLMPESIERPVVTDTAMYGASQGTIVAYDAKTLGSKTVTDRRGKKQQVPALKKLWTLPNDQIQDVPTDKKQFLAFLSENPLRIDLLAGNTLYGHQGNLVFALRLPSADKPASVVWKKRIEGRTATMISADDKLFAVTRGGKLYSFGPERVAKPKAFPKLAVTFTEAKETDDRASRILRQTGQQDGYALCFGLEDGRLIEALARRSKLFIVAIDPDEEKVNAVRRRLDTQGLYGSRIVCHIGDPVTYGLPPYLANLIVSEKAEGVSDPRMVKQTFHCLRPYGGTASFLLSRKDHEAFAKHARGLGLPKAKVGREESATLLVREGALPGSGNWTHEYGDAQNTLSSTDKLVKAPLGLLWFGGPASNGKLFYDRHDWGPSAAIIDGRMFLQGPGIFTAVDVYTGRILWQKKLPVRKALGRRGNFTNTGFHFVATDDSIYLNDAETILRMDPRTGERLAQIPPPKGAEGWGRLRVWRGFLLVTVFHKKKLDKNDPRPAVTLPDELLAMDRFTGKVIWSKKADRGFQLFSLGKEDLFAFDGFMPDLYAAMKRKGRIPKALAEKSLTSIDLRTGKTKWKHPTDQIVSWLSSSTQHGVVLTSNKASIVARRARDGAILWENKNEGKGFRGHPESVWDKVILLGDKVIDQRGPGLAYELKTGLPILRKNPLSGKMEPWQFTKAGHHCNYAIANDHIMTFRAASAGFCDLESANTARWEGFRSGCRNSLIPANGVLNAPNMAHGCICGYSLFTSLAMVHIPDAEMWSYSALKAPSAPLQRVGLNFGAPGDRLAVNGTLWLDHPNVGGTSPSVKVAVAGKELRYFRRLAEQIQGEGLRWVVASGVEGVSSVKVTFPAGKAPKRRGTIKLYFAEWKKDAVGQRLFDVALDGKTVIEGLDVYKEAEGPRRLLVKELADVEIPKLLTLTFKASVDRPVLCGLEIIAE